MGIGGWADRGVPGGERGLLFVRTHNDFETRSSRKLSRECRGGGTEYIAPEGQVPPNKPVSICFLFIGLVKEGSGFETRLTYICFTFIQNKFIKSSY